VLQDLVALVSVDICDLIAVETSTTTTTNKLDGVQVCHPKFDQSHGDEDGSATKTSDAVYSNGGN
jgi:hypothetical protein